MKDFMIVFALLLVVLMSAQGQARQIDDLQNDVTKLQNSVRQLQQNQVDAFIYEENR